MLFRSVPELASVPVIVLTSCHDPEVLNRVWRFPISGYHLKPLTPGRLAKKLRALLDQPKRLFNLAEQTGRLERAIELRTEGRVRNLRVETVNGRVIVRGRSENYQVKHFGAGRYSRSV